MLKVFQRYLASNFIFPFLFSTAFFVSFLLIFQIFRLIRIITSKGVGPMVVLELFGHIAISFLPMATPLSVLFAAIYTMNKLSEDSEVVAMRSFGIRKTELFAPFFILGLSIAIAIFALNRNLIPYSKTLFKNTVIQLTSNGMVTNIKEGKFFTEIPNVTLFAEKVSEEGKKLKEVFIKIENENKEQIIFADRGALVKQVLSKLRTPSLRLNLVEGNITTTYKDKDQVEKVLFKEYDFPILSGGNLPGFVTKDSMRTNKQLMEIIKKRSEKINVYKKKKENSKEALPANEEDDYKNLSKDLIKSKLEYYGRLNTPFQILIFIFLGFCLGIKKGRGRTRNSGSLGLIMLFGYYALFFLGISFARKGGYPPGLAVFFPTIISCFVSGYFFKKIDWFS